MNYTELGTFSPMSFSSNNCRRRCKSFKKNFDTSFLHAIWAGIAGYFISLSFLYPKNRKALRLLGILIPAVLHGMYDSFGWSLIGLFISYLGAVLLIVYLQRAKDFQNKLLP
ncbi:MAG: PrsW family intramembrane metalloprotease [Taibaiella sp.]|nr:PrsW family intramembrane metalloprotease [Taibaiella sp.]